MARSPIQHVEAFHLVLLKLLEVKLDRANFVVKGGVNLRAWFGSARYSEDLDIDVSHIGVNALARQFDKMLASPALLALLGIQRLTIVRSSKPKQTDTTQRWKFLIQPTDSEAILNTKVEFSRRGSPDPYTLDPVRPEIVAPYGLPAPTVNHYTAASAIRQKIGALAGRKVTQARDIWDLDHLIRTTAADPRPLPAKLAGVLGEAAERVLEMPFADYQAQVVPYLTVEHQELFGNATAWERMRDLIFGTLLELQK